MATVYLGRDVRLDRVVALKIAHAELAGDHEFVRRFIGEARAAAQLSSPNVVAVFDQGSDGDINYIAMEYVPGQTLRELLSERGALSVRGGAGHHRGRAGRPGRRAPGGHHPPRRQARERAARPGRRGQGGRLRPGPRGRRRQPSTNTGMIIGTAAYLAPEQVSASTSDARTDVYAAGVMLFEMLTGVQPHTGETPLDTSPTSTSTRSSRRRRPGCRGCRPRWTPWSPWPPAATRTCGRPTPGSSWRRSARSGTTSCRRRGAAVPTPPAARTRPAASRWAAACRPAASPPATRRQRPAAPDPLRDPLAQPRPGPALPGRLGAAPGPFGTAAAARPRAGAWAGGRLPGRHRPRPRGDRLGRLRRQRLRAPAARTATCAAASPACPRPSAGHAGGPAAGRPAGAWSADGGPGEPDGQPHARGVRRHPAARLRRRRLPAARPAAARHRGPLAPGAAPAAAAVQPPAHLHPGRPGRGAGRGAGGLVADRRALHHHAQGDRADRPGGHLGADGPSTSRCSAGPASTATCRSGHRAEHQPGPRRQGQAGRHDHHRRLARPGPDRRPAGDRAADRPRPTRPCGPRA